jgi:hypothetical protein
LDPSKPDRTDLADTDALHASSATGFLNRVRWFDSGRGHSRYEGKEKGLDEREKVLAGRAKELEEREAALNLREAQLEAALSAGRAISRSPSRSCTRPSTAASPSGGRSSRAKTSDSLPRLSTPAVTIL